MAVLSNAALLHRHNLTLVGNGTHHFGEWTSAAPVYPVVNATEGYEHNNDTQTESNVEGISLFSENPFLIHSPNYPNQYGDNQYRTYHVVGRFGSRIKFNSLAFSLEDSGCIFDYVEITEVGYDETLSLGGRYCGTNGPRNIVSSTNVVNVTFRSDSSISSSGFVITAQRTQEPATIFHGGQGNDTGSGHNETYTTGGHFNGNTTHFDYVYETTQAYWNGTFEPEHNESSSSSAPEIEEPSATVVETEEEGQILSFSSHNFPNEYPALENHMYIVYDYFSERIQFGSPSFELENSFDCVYDYVQFSEWSSSGLVNLGPRRCGIEGIDFVSSTNRVYVKFVTDGSVQKSGFHIYARGTTLPATVFEQTPVNRTMPLHMAKK